MPNEIFKYNIHEFSLDGSEKVISSNGCPELDIPTIMKRNPNLASIAVRFDPSRDGNWVLVTYLFFNENPPN